MVAKLQPFLHSDESKKIKSAKKLKKQSFCKLDFANFKISSIFALYNHKEPRIYPMEAFYRTHAYLIEHTNAPVRRTLMDEIDWNDRLIGIKGTRFQRGQGKIVELAKTK